MCGWKNKGITQLIRHDISTKSVDRTLMFSTEERITKSFELTPDISRFMDVIFYNWSFIRI